MFDTNVSSAVDSLFYVATETFLNVVKKKTPQQNYEVKRTWRFRQDIHSQKIPCTRPFIRHFIKLPFFIYLSARAFMCHFLLSLETSEETMVPPLRFLLFCLCSAKHDGTNEPIKCAGGCAVPGGASQELRRPD